MVLDDKTIIFCNFVISGCIASVLGLYQIRQKTYEGFGFWVAGTLALSIGYLVFISRVFFSEYASILFTNAVFTLGTALRLDGGMRFVRGAKLPKFYYLAAMLQLGISFYLMENSPLRHLFGLLIISGFSAATGVVFLDAKNNGRLFFSRALGFAALLWTLLLLTRNLLLQGSPPVDPLASDFHQLFYFSASLGLEAFISVMFLLLNSHRIESELNEANSKLGLTLEELKESVSRIKILSGLLPICSHCKRIRDEESGGWRQLENYISSRSQAQFSHGVCPECAKVHYGEYMEDPGN
jgi:hypothetical protein